MKKVAILLLLLLLVACNRSDEVTTPTPETDTVVEDVTNNTDVSPSTEDEIDTAVATETDAITLRMIAYDWELSSYRALIETFEAENPGIQIKVVSLEETLGLDSVGVGQWPEDAGRRLVSAVDVVTTNAIGIGRQSEGLLLDLRPLLEADTAFNRDDFYSNALEYFENGGGLWGLPTTLNFSLIFYDKDAFDAAGHDYPQAGWSWDDLLAAAQATTMVEDDEVVRWGLVQSSRNPFEFVRPRTGPLVDTDTDPPTPRFDRPEVAEALQWYVDLFLLHQVAPDLEPPEPDEDGSFIPPEYDLINNGQAAMWSEYSGSWQWRSSQMNLGVAPFPVDNPDDHSTPLFVNGYVVSAGTRHPEAAWRWINFLSQQPSADEFSQDTAVPARRSVAEADGFWDRVDSELGDALRYALDHAYVNRFGPGYGAFFEAAQAVFEGEQPADEALAAAQAQAETEIADFIVEQEGAEDVEVVIIEPEDTAVPEGAVTILFTAAGGPGGIQPIRDLADAFQEARPDVVVELQPPDFGVGPVNLRDVAAVSDCLQWFGGVSSAEDRAAVLNLEPFLAADPELNRDDFYPAAVESFAYQGQ